MKFRRKARGLSTGAMVVGAFLILGATYALTAANTVNASKAGDGSGGITGYTVSGVHYTLNATDPTLIDAVAFNLNSAPVAGSTVKAQLAAAGPWYACTATGTAVSCATTSPAATVAGASSLRAIVAD